jgi:hypothetical protein
MNKNAYEIRLDVLSMAHGDEYDKFHLKLETLRNSEGRLEDAKAIEALIPKTDDILQRAEELYQFITDKG